MKTQSVKRKHLENMQIYLNTKIEQHFIELFAVIFVFACFQKLFSSVHDPLLTVVYIYVRRKKNNESENA